MKFGFRWYNPVTGTWTQQDTLDTPLDPGNANRYVFAGGDPINNSDPSGRNTLSNVLGACALGVVQNLAIGFGLGALTAGSSIVVAAAAGCVVGAGIQIISEAYPAAGNGLGYISFLLDIGQVGNALL